MQVSPLGPIHKTARFGGRPRLGIPTYRCSGSGQNPESRVGGEARAYVAGHRRSSRRPHRQHCSEFPQRNAREKHSKLLLSGVFTCESEDSFDAIHEPVSRDSQVARALRNLYFCTLSHWRLLFPPPSHSTSQPEIYLRKGQVRMHGHGY
jgi:hypothetical protein